MEETCRTCIYFVASKLNPEMGWCVAETPRVEVYAYDHCPDYWPKPGAREEEEE